MEAAARGVATVTVEDGFDASSSSRSGIPTLVGSQTFNNSDSAIDSEITEHLWPLSRVVDYYKTDPQKGLSSTQVGLNRIKYGANKISPPKDTPKWIKYLSHYTNFFAILLIVAAILCFLAYFLDKYNDTTNLYLAGVLFLVVIVSATFEYAQEARSEHVMEGFRKLLPSRCHVIREGSTIALDAEDLVPGDLVDLNEGDRVPADILILRASDLRVDNSSITGESEPVERGSELLNASKEGYRISPLEASNLVFYTTIVASGSAQGIVVASGDRTVMGRIAGMVTKSKRLDTPIAVEINAFVTMISGSAIFMGLLFGILSFAIGNPIIETIVFAIGVIVANVPEGLMASVTVSLAMAAKRMHSRCILVKTLQSVETLGSATVIASDKTGTLTQNRMLVQHCWYDLQVKRVPLIRHKSEAESMRTSTEESSIYDLDSPTFQRLLLIATICNNATFLRRNVSDDSDELDFLSAKCIGDASETGLLRFVEPLNSSQHIREKWPKLHEIKFNSVNKWQLSIHRRPNGSNNSPLLVMKGAPERVLDKCSKIMINGESVELTNHNKSEYLKAYQELGGYGERVLGFAFKDLTEFSNDFKFTSKPELNFPTEDLTFVGLLSLIDPPREGVFEAVAKCKRARIKVMMVTGDHPITAQAIAKQVGILDQENLEIGRAKVITGDDIRQLSELRILDQQRRWDEILSHEQLVFARVSPAHKLAIVEHSQRNGEIIAVTGDGVNDAPALKKADIGIAMGIAGKDVTKEAADMILMDDNFASIVSGVEEGRLIFDNLKKTICYALTVNMPELIPFLANVLLKIPLPLSTVLMLAICLGTDMLPAVSLAYEEKESDIMDRPPRNSKTERLVSNRLFAHAYLIIGIVQTFAGFLAYLAVLNDYGYVPRILPGNGLDFTTNPLICTVDKNNEPLNCGYGCDSPSYHLGLPTLVEYCKDGCSIPLSSSPVDPFSEFDHDGFKGVEYCSLTCSSPASMFPGGVLPSQCSNSSDLSKKIGFPGRGKVGRPYAPKNGFYWWGGKKQPVPNVRYQKEVLFYAQSAYFIACVVTQWANLVVCKTTKVSLLDQGLKNQVLNFALFFETVVAVILLYVPGFQTVFKTRPINVIYWLAGLPFAIGILAVGEIRKGIIRSYPGGWMEKWTYW